MNFVEVPLGRAITRRSALTVIGAGALGVTMSPTSAQEISATFTGVLSGPVIDFNPHRAISTSDGIVNPLIYEGLIGALPSGEIEGVVAESWSSTPDGLTWTFKLKPDTTFHNGRPLTADDVVFSFDNVLRDAKASMNSILKDKLTEVKALNAHAVQFRLSGGGDTFLKEVSLCTRTAILPREAFSADGELKDRIGSGMFKFVSADADGNLVLARNNLHRGVAQLPEEVRILVDPDAAGRISTLKTGTADWVFDVPFNVIDGLRGDGYEIGIVDIGNLLRLTFNHTRPPFSSVEARRAVAAAIDRTAIAAAEFAGMATVANQPFQPDTAMHLDVADIQFEPDLAVNILSTQPAKKITAVVVNPEGYLESVWEKIISDLERVGFEIQFESLPDAQAFERLQNKDYDLILIGQSHPYHWSRVYDYYNPASTNNYLVGGYSNYAATQALEAAHQPIEIMAQRSAYTQVLDLLQDDVASVFLFVVPWTHALRPGNPSAQKMVSFAMRYADPY